MTTRAITGTGWPFYLPVRTPIADGQMGQLIQAGIESLSERVSPTVPRQHRGRHPSVRALAILCGTGAAVMTPSATDTAMRRTVTRASERS
jgi:hypothetical protein